MGKTITKSICLLLCLVLVLSMVPAAFATEAETELFDISGSSMTLGNTLEINFAIDTAKLTGTDNYIVISKEYADERGTVSKTVQQSDWTRLSASTSYVSYSVSAKEMNDKLTVVAYNAAGEQLTNVYEDSVAAYCLRTLAKEEAKAASDPQKLALFVDMLNYGAAAQTEWGYNTDALADADLTEAQKGYATPVPQKNNILSQGEGYYGTSLSLKENILMNVAYNAKGISDAAYAVVTFVDHYGNDESVTVQAEDFLAQGSNIKYISIEVMAVADYSQAVTVTLYDAEDNAISTTVDSVESYLSRKTGALYDAIAAFGVGAYNYFHTNPNTGDNTTVITGTVSAQDGTVTEDTSFSDGDLSAQVPAGVQVEGSTLTLTVTEKSASDSGVALEEGQDILPLDIHIDGVSAENATPIQVCLGKILPGGLNIGNVTLYHVEDGVANAMTQVMTLAELDEHNEFYYDPITGDITVAMASFSEVAMVSTDALWNGEADHSWYDADAEELIIANADQLWSLSQIVGGMAKDDEGNDIAQDSFAGKTVKLIADIDLDDAESDNDSAKIFYPIGYNSDDGKYEKTGVAVSTGFYTFQGTFDGQGHTISNFYQNTWEMKGDHNWYDATLQYYRDGMGLFGKVYGGTVKNLTVKNFSSDGEITTTGTIAAYADCGATFENIAIFNCNPRVYNIGNGGIVGCVGWYTSDVTTEKVAFKNITVDNSNKISALWGSYDVACGGLVGQYYPTSGQSSANYPANPGIYMENCHVAAQMDVYNDVCANYQYYAYRYAGMLIGSIRENETIDGHVYPKMDGIEAKGCTVHFGDWNDYYYCELVANSLASYTHDHQFSRLEQVASVDVENMTVTSLKGVTTDIPTSGRVNYVVVTGEHATENATCYHFVDGNVHSHDDYDGDGIDDKETVDGQEIFVENNRHIYLEFDQLFTGYGWGVTSKGLTDYEGVENMDITHSDNEKAVVKFNSIAQESYTTGTTVTIGELFESANAAIAIDVDNVQVFVSPVGDDSTAEGTYAPNTADWTQGTLTFSGTGAATISITDYNYCETTTINVTINELTDVDKFQAKAENLTFSKATVTLGEIFAEIENPEVAVDDATVTVSAVDAEGNSVADAVYDTTTWENGTLTFNGYTGEVTVTIQDSNRCNEYITTITLENAVKFDKLFDGDFLYRVGNNSTTPVNLSSLFAQSEDYSGTIGTVAVTIENIDGTAGGTYTANATWGNGTIQFTGTGVVKLTITDNDYCIPTELYLEVVNATNVTVYSELKNQASVLLDDITMTSGGSYYLSGATLYGNGFTLDVTNGAYDGTGYVSNNYLVSLNNAALDNVQIKGAVYTSYGAQAADDYNRPAVLCAGSNTIKNCYISNCAAPVRVRDGNLEIIDSTLKGGNFANLDIRNGNVVLENVTTINQSNGNDKAADGTNVVGLGVVFYYEQVQSTTTVEIKGTLTQYNYISDNDSFSNAYAKKLVDVMLGSSHTDLQLEENGVTYANAGIVSMTAGMSANIIDSRTDKDGYVGKTVTFQSVDGYVYTIVPTSERVAETAPVYTATTQGAIAPSYSFDFTTKNYVEKTEDSNDYCYADSGVVQISMDEGESFSWDTSILTATKYNHTLDYTVSMDGTDYTGKSITFNTSGNYKVEYTYTDPYNYTMDGENVATYSKIYTQTVEITVSVIAPEAKNAEFTFGSSNTASTQVSINNLSYVMPNVTATSSTVGSITVSGTTVYYPIVDAYTSDGETAHSSLNSWYMCFPVFKNAVTITDYADGGTGSAVTYGSSTTSMPSGLSLIAYSGYLSTTPSGAVSLTTGGADAAFKYQASTAASSTPTTLDSVLIYASPTLSNNARNELYLLVQYQYKDNAGATYYYFVGYHMPQTTTKNICVTADTLVTLADGSQKRIDEVTYSDELLVWNFFTGEYDVAPAAILFYHGDDLYEVLKLAFDDGTEVKVITNHGFFDVASNNWVFIDKNNAESFVGHDFVKTDADGYSTVKLVDYAVIEEYTGSYSVQTAQHNNFVVEGLFSITMPEYEGWFDYFEIGEGMKYDEEKMQADIEKYGLYTYEDFAQYVTYEQFIAFNGPYLKVLVGRGVVTYEQILELIESYVAPLG